MFLKKLYVYLYVIIVKFYYFVLHSNCILYLHMYVICDFGYQIMCEYIIIHCVAWIKQIKINRVKKIQR
jgi:hypothetical protein